MTRIARPGVGEAGDDAVDLRLRADVDAVRRLVEDQHARPRRQPPGEGHLLPVAAGEQRDHLVDPGGPHVVGGDRLGARPRARPPTSVTPSRASAADDRQRDVGDDALGHDQPLAVAILRQVGEPALQHLAAASAARSSRRRANRRRRSAASSRSRPGRSPSGRRRPARPCRRSRRRGPRRRRRRRRRRAPRFSTRSTSRARRAAGALGEQRLERAADHHLHDLRRGQARRAGRVATCAPSRSTVTSSAIRSSSSSRWVISMTAVPRVAQAADDAEQLLRLGRRQRRGRLVEDQQPQVGGQRPGDLDELQLGHRKPGDQRPRVDRDAELPERVAGARRTSRCGRPCRAAVSGGSPIAMFSATSRCGKSFGSW